jgi:hypothetical protein
VRLLKGHPFLARTEEGEAADEEQVQQISLTQLAPEQQLVPAEVLSGEQLPAFKVCCRGDLTGPEFLVDVAATQRR